MTGGDVFVYCFGSTLQRSPSIRLIDPFVPNDVTSVPVAASMQNRRERLFRKIRSLPPS